MSNKNKRLIFATMVIAGVLLACSAAHAQQAPSATDTREVLTLEQAIALAAEHNRSLRLAELDTLKAQDQIDATRTRRLPKSSVSLLGAQLLNTVSFEFEKGAFGDFPATGPIPDKDTKISTPRRPSIYMVGNVTQPLSQLYQINLGIHQAELAKQDKEQEVRKQRFALVQRVRSLYYAALDAEATLTASRDAIAFYKEMDRLTGELLSQQAALKSDNLDVRARLAKEEYDALTQENRLAQMKEQLNVEMGRDVNLDFRLAPVPEVSTLESNLAAAREQAVAMRPELRSAQLKIQQAEQDRKIKRAEYIPEVSLAFNYLSPFNIEVLPKNIASVGLQLTWEPWDWGRRKREVQEKSRAKEQAEIAARETEARILIEVSQAHRKLREARALVGVARSSQESAQEKMRVAKNRFAEQAVLYKDVLQAQNENAQALKSYQQAVLAYWSARADFEKAIGEGQ